MTIEPWADVLPLPPLNDEISATTATLDGLREAWEIYVQSRPPAEVREARERTLRRHAIETGIIERLYEVDWGVTEALVAEGLTLDAVSREGFIEHDALDMIQSHMNALDMVVDAVRHGRPLSIGFIKELHSAITQQQQTYQARDQFGRELEKQLLKGAWKVDRNDVLRPDGSLLEFTPPDQVGSQMDSLLEIFANLHAHPIVAAAWLHHRFVRIHPFQDGNGRTARALTLTVLLTHRFAPIVVDRRSRTEYLATLDDANGGNLVPLIRFFATLEAGAIRSELSAPSMSSSGQVHPVARVLARDVVAGIRERRALADIGRQEAAALVASSVDAKVYSWLSELGQALQEEFRSVDESASTWVSASQPGQPEGHYWRALIVKAARSVDFFADIQDGTWWNCLHVRMLGQHLRYGVVVQKAGRADLGVLAVTTFGEVIADRSGSPDDADETPPRAEFLTAFESSPTDAVSLLYSSDPDERWVDVQALLERTSAAAVVFLGGLIS